MLRVSRVALSEHGASWSRSSEAYTVKKGASHRLSVALVCRQMLHHFPTNASVMVHIWTLERRAPSYGLSVAPPAFDWCYGAWLYAVRV